MSRYLPVPKSALIAFLLLLSLVLAAGCAPAAQESGDEEEVAQTEDAIDETGALIEFEQPEHGSVVPGPDVTAEVEVENFDIVDKIGEDPVEGEGHIHWILDGGAPMVGTADSTVLTGLKDGEHTLVAELHDNNHDPLDPPVTADVQFTVGEGDGTTPGAGVMDDDDNGDDKGGDGDRGDNSGPGGGGDDDDDATSTTTVDDDDETTSTTAMEDETTSTTSP